MEDGALSLQQMGAEAVIPCNCTRKIIIPYDTKAYRRAIASSAASTASCTEDTTLLDVTGRTIHFRGFVHFASAMIWMALKGVLCTLSAYSGISKYKTCARDDLPDLPSCLHFLCMLRCVLERKKPPFWGGFLFVLSDGDIWLRGQDWLSNCCNRKLRAKRA